MDSATKSSQVKLNLMVLSYLTLSCPILSRLIFLYLTMFYSIQICFILSYLILFYLALQHSDSSYRHSIEQVSPRPLPHYSTSLLPPITAPVYVSLYRTVLVSHIVPAQHHYHDHYYSHCYCMLLCMQHCTPYCLCVCVCVGSGELAHVPHSVWLSFSVEILEQNLES